MAKVISKIMINNTPHEICSKYLGGYTYDDIRGEIQDSVGSVIQDLALKPLKNITYYDLVNLCNNGLLVPGQSYRIIDYVTTTTQENTKSAKHNFDIIVEALSENTLSENAKAIQNENDGYFDEANLEAWELKYCLDNDASRFAWADVNGKGVIYYMKDEFNNECPYDFKNIKFYHQEKGNLYLFTFSWVNENGDVEDLTLRQDLFSNKGVACGTHDNIIKTYYNNRQILNDVTFVSSYLHDSGYFYGCYSNSFGNNCHSNSFGDSCYSNSFGNDCYSNSFGDYCRYNSFGDYCRDNSFGSNCASNSFGDSCGSNSFGYNCYSNIFGNFCKSNNFGNDCDSNSFGNYCEFNGFYDDSSYSYSEDLDEYIGDGEKLNFVQYVTLNEECHHLLFHTSEVINENNKVQNIIVTKRVKSIEINENDGCFIPLLLEIPVTNNEYELKIARNIKGDIKMYCEADLIM